MDDEYYLQHPKNQRFYKVICYFMSMMCLNSQVWSWFVMPKKYWFNFIRYFIYIATPIFTISQTVYLFLNYTEHEFNTLSMMYAIIPVSYMLWLKVSIAQTKSYKTAMTNFMNEIHLFNYYYKNRDEYVRKVLITAEKFSRWSNYYYMSLCYICWFSFETFPIINNLQNNESTHNITSRLEIMIHLWLPFDYEFNFFNWVIVQMASFYAGFLAMTAIILFDTVTLIFFYHIIGHIKLLKHRMKNSFSNDLSQEDVKHNLISISRYFTFIKKTVSETEDAFGLNVAGIYLHNLVGGGLFIYQFMTSGSDTGTILTFGLMIPIYMGGLVVMSLVLEDIRIEADDIPDLLYSLQWENMSLSNQKLVLMILLQVQSTVEFNAAFNIKTGINPAISILKTTFSFYVMIKSRM